MIGLAASQESSDNLERGIMYNILMIQYFLLQLHQEGEIGNSEPLLRNR